MKNKNINTLVPKLRFPEFENEGEWNIEIFNNVFTRITKKNKENNQNILTISAQKGLVSQLDYFNKSIAAKDVSGYYLIEKGDFAYNKSYSQGYPMGAIKSLKYYDKGVVSTLYICFKIKGNYNTSFFEQYFDSGIFNCKLEKVAQEGARNHGLLNININEFFNLELMVPKSDEQQKIADLFTSLDELIAEQSQKLNTLKNHKKGLMQKLFPAEGETLPKLRFPEFKGAGNWELLPIGERLEMLSGYPFKGSDISEDSTGKPLMRGINITEGNIRHSRDIDRFYHGDINTLKKYILKVNDLVIGMDGSKVGKNSALITEKDAGSLLVQRVARLRARNKNTIQFISQQINSTIFHSYVDRNNTSGGIPHISLKQIQEFQIYFPPTDQEQHKIADCLSLIDDLIEEQSNKLAALQMHKKGLMQQVFPTYE